MGAFSTSPRRREPEQRLCSISLHPDQKKKRFPTSVYIEDYLGKGESILIIDDAPEQRDLAGRMMQRLGYDVHTADSGEAAVALIKKEDPMTC
jgi:PleD family two-component response regulator